MMRRTMFKRCAAAASAGGEAEGPLRYALPSRWLHWINGAGMLSCVGLVLAAQKGYPAWDKCTKEEAAAKTNLMFWHKSIGFTMLFVAVPRVALRLANRAPRPLPISSVENALGQASHTALLALALVLPISGTIMGYYGPYGMPFYTTTLKPGSGEFGKALDGKLAGTAYNIHSKAGIALEYLIPLHVTAAFGHQFYQGINIFTRINPFV